jgi:hypothetical protein
MLENVMQLVLDSSPSLPGMLELLEGFQLVAKRAAVKRAVERHTSAFYARFMAELNAVKRHLAAQRRSPPASPMLPHYAGIARCGRAGVAQGHKALQLLSQHGTSDGRRGPRAHVPTCRAATSLLKRLEQLHAALMGVKHMLPVVPEAADALAAYELTHQALEQLMVNTHRDWFNTVDAGISKQLHNNLLVQDKADRECDSWGRQRVALSVAALASGPSEGHVHGACVSRHPQAACCR